MSVGVFPEHIAMIYSLGKAHIMHDCSKNLCTVWNHPICIHVCILSSKCFSLCHCFCSVLKCCYKVRIY